MSIRPIDLQVVVSRSQDIHAAKQSVVNKVENDLLKMQDLTNKERIRQKSQVEKTQKTENGRIDDNKVKTNEERGSNKQEQKQSKSEDCENKEEKKELVSDSKYKGTRFDMRI